METKHDETIAKMFNKIADKYDFLNRLLSLGQDQRWRRDLAKEMLPYDSKNVKTRLDLATGTGDVILTSLKDPRMANDFFWGIDISENMLNIAQNKIYKYLPDNKNIRFKKCSAEKLSFKEHTFDSISMAFGLRNTKNPIEVIDECHRVLKPNSKLLILEFFPLKNRGLEKIFQLYFNFILPKIGGLISDKEAYTYLPKSVSKFSDFAIIKKMLENSGFQIDKTKSYIFGACKLIVASK